MHLATTFRLAVLSAPLSKRERGELEAMLRDLGTIATPVEHWCAVGALRASLRRAGISISAPDAHVAQCALDLDADLWSTDAIFRHAARRTPLRVRS